MLDEELMRQAIRAAQDSVRRGGGPFGAVVARNGRIVGTGGNEVAIANDPSAHAEIVAIRAACRALGAFRLSGCVLYASCEPCPMCLGALYWARIDRLVFACGREDAAAAGFDDERIFREMSLPAESRSLPAGRLLRREGRVAFRDWLARPDKIPY